MRFGKQEKRFLLFFCENNGVVSTKDVCKKFVKWVNHAGYPDGYPDLASVKRVLDKLEQKQIIRVEKRGLSNSKVKLNGMIAHSKSEDETKPYGSIGVHFNNEYIIIDGECRKSETVYYGLPKDFQVVVK